MKALIRNLISNDPQPIAAAFAAQGWHKPAEQYEGYFAEQEAGRRDVLIAEWGGAFVGYVTIVWESHYPPFLEAGIPEVVDFNVLIEYQRRGIGTALMDAAENRIAERADSAGIGVGLMSDYGNAQRMYAKRGYVPDGRGIFAHGRWIETDEMLKIDHDVALYWTKTLR